MKNTTPKRNMKAFDGSRACKKASEGVKATPAREPAMMKTPP
jgi:hypothetical protein